MSPVFWFDYGPREQGCGRILQHDKTGVKALLGETTNICTRLYKKKEAQGRLS